MARLEALALDLQEARDMAAEQVDDREVRECELALAIVIGALHGLCTSLAKVDRSL